MIEGVFDGSESGDKSKFEIVSKELSDYVKSGESKNVGGFDTLLVKIEELSDYVKLARLEDELENDVKKNRNWMMIGTGINTCATFLHGFVNEFTRNAQYDGSFSSQLRDKFHDLYALVQPLPLGFILDFGLSLLAAIPTLKYINSFEKKSFFSRVRREGTEAGENFKVEDFMRVNHDDYSSKKENVSLSGLIQVMVSTLSVVGGSLFGGYVSGFF